MSSPRAVRIPRSPGTFPSPAAGPPAAEPPGAPAFRAPPRPNRAGTQRVMRLTIFYLIVLAALYAGFVLYARGTPGGSSPGTQGALAEFGLVAVVLALAGAVFTLSQAPRAVEPLSDGIAVVGRWGRRTEWAPLAEVTVRVVRRYPAGLLSGEPVESVEVFAPGRRPRNYLVESGLLGAAYFLPTAR